MFWFVITISTKNNVAINFYRGLAITLFESYCQSFVLIGFIFTQSNKNGIDEIFNSVV